jgi:hypothetical protein
MTQSIFGPPAGGSFTENIQRALDFANANVRRSVPGAAAAEVADTSNVGALVGEAASEGGPAGNAAIATELGAPVAAAPAGDDLAAAARAAAEASIADPAYLAAAQQQVDVVVQPRIIVQGPSGPVVVPVDVPIPAAQANVMIQPGQAVVIDAATGQPVAAAAAGAAGGDASAVRGLRSWGAADFGRFFGGGGRPEAVAAPAAQAIDAGGAPAAAAGSGGLRESLGEALQRARGTQAANVVAEGAAEPARALAAPRPGLLDRIRANAPDLATLRGTGGGTAAAADIAADVATDAAQSVGRSGLLDELRRVAQVASKVK